MRVHYSAPIFLAVPLHMSSTKRSPLQKIAAVSWPGLLLYTTLWLLLGAGSGAFGAYWLLTRYHLKVPVNSQALTIDLPEELFVDVELQQMDADAIPNLSADELVLLPVRLKDDINVMISLDSELPLKLTVPYKGKLPFNTTLPVDTVVKTKILGIPMNLPISANIPVQSDIDVDLSIPINQTIPVAFTAPVRVKLDHLVQIPIPAKQEARISMEKAQMPITVHDSEFVMPLANMKLTAPDEPKKP